MSYAAVIVVAVFVTEILLLVFLKNRGLRLYHRKVGLDLTDLIALLPEENRRDDFDGFRAHVSGGKILVGLTYPTTQLYRGNPPNVGLEFDLSSGQLIRVLPDGVGLGIK